MTRMCVRQIEHDPVEWLYAVSCFCGWSADTVYEEREDAERAWEHHRSPHAIGGRR